ncbi:MAG: hypothetical protein A2498_02745 [Lentisphaerae bacterium RIFOXYC12_FULL_60_16]|nr:MAG: hypothetical protein A2498_02745 [Lentisphaerae bacterium RIFOXYC12_FULL_60_16]OGV77447.1 MAG: hypothetical protein A2340_06760 [Lentisphaerae bacterium RIFOXYB12_FULL_60_10]
MAVAAAGVLLAGVSSVHAADFSTWQKKLQIRFAGYNKPETLSDFPALVVFSTNTAGFAYNQFLSATNADLRFTDDTQTNELNYELELWDTNAIPDGTSFAWVRVPALAGTNTSIWAFWGKSGATAPAYRTNGAVWASSYLGVWHMDQPSDTDSSSRGYHGTAQGTVVQAGGRVGNANDLDPTADFVKVTDRDDFTMIGDYTVSAWVHRDTMGSWRAFCGTYNGAGFIFALDGTVDGTVQFWDGAWRPSGIAVTAGAWNHIAYTRTGSDGRFYLNGSNVATIANAQACGNGADLELGGGGISWSSYRFDGRVDEVRIANVKRSSNWLWASWRNQAFPGSFVTNTGVQVGGMPLVLNRTATNVNATSANMNGNLVSTGLASTVVRVFWGTSDAGQVRSGWTTTNSFPGCPAVGLMTTNISTLVANTLYYYRYYATNSVGEWWADPASVLITGEIGIRVTDGNGAEQGADPLRFSIYRGAAVSGAPLSVNYTLSGTAGNGTDYETLSGTIIIPPAATNMVLQVTPIHDQLTGEASEDIIVTLAVGPYRIGPSNCATGAIANSGTKGWFVSTTGTDTNTGASWATAYLTIANGIANATTAGDEVFVAAGTYNTAALIAIANGIRVVGVNGPASTIVRRSSGSARIFNLNHASAVLEGFTVSDATVGGVYLQQGTITNCHIVNNFAPQVKGGGILMEGGALVNCVVSNNVQRDQTWGPGGGIYLQAGTVTQCKIVNNTVNGGGLGGYGVGAGAGAMVRGGVLENCLIYGNKATYTADGNGDGAGVYQTGGIVRNCTIASNRCASSRSGAGIYRTGGTVTNTIVYGNKKGTDDQNITGTNGVFYSCSPDLTTSVTTHNTSDDPLFVGMITGNCHLLPTSPCIDAGKDLTGMSSDLDGQPRPIDGNRDTVAVTDMGCYESPTAESQPLGCSFSAAPSVGFNSLDAVFTAAIGGGNTNVTWYGWDFDNNGSYERSGAGWRVVTNTYGLGNWTAKLVVSNTALERAVYTKLNAARVYPTVYYASQSGNNTAPYDTLGKGGTNIQTVIDYAYAPGTTAITVRVAAGTWTVPARLDITKPLAVRSVSGPGATILRITALSRVVFMTHASAVLDGFTVRDSTRGGVELQQGLVTNCYIVSNSAPQIRGGGIFIDTGTMVNSVVSNNWQTDPTWGPGGGVYLQAGRVATCRIVNNRILGGGLGGYGVGAGAGIVMRGGILENSLIYGNKATYTVDGNGDGGGVYQTAGVIRNCTVASNQCSATRYGAGVYKTGGTITNTIVYGNKRGSEDNNIAGTNNVFYSSSPDLFSSPVTHNTSENPLFYGMSTGNCHLLPTAPCIDTGKDLAGVTIDLEGTGRPIDGNNDSTAVTDMGCYEAPNSGTLPLSCSFTVGPEVGLESVTAIFQASVAGANTNITWYGWDFNNDGTPDKTGAGLNNVTNTFSLGFYTVKLTASNTVPQGTTYTMPNAVRAYPTVLYASPSGSNQPPYNSWAKAATNIQTAIDYAYTPATATVRLWVASGTYTLPARLDIGKGLRVQSASGPVATILRKPTGTRGVFVAHSRAVLSGFTVRDCAVGGVELQAGLVTNCYLINNPTVTTYGGGLNVSGGTATTCRVANNSNAGGNWSPGGGVWMSGGLVVNCLITNNLGAGGFWQFSTSGGGVYLNGGTLRNCLVAWNRTTSGSQGNGGGVYSAGRLENCTVVSNTCTAGLTGGGVYLNGGSVTNSIIWYNRAGTVTNNLNMTNKVGYSCSPTLVAGVNGNLSTNPQFQDRDKGDFRIMPGSPCKDKGRAFPWMAGGRDLAGNARVLGAAVDMGAYEVSISRGGIFQFR